MQIVRLLTHKKVRKTHYHHWKGTLSTSSIAASRHIYQKGDQKAGAKGSVGPLKDLKKDSHLRAKMKAGDADRTRDSHDGNVKLYRWATPAKVSTLVRLLYINITHHKQKHKRDLQSRLRRPFRALRRCETLSGLRRATPKGPSEPLLSFPP